MTVCFLFFDSTAELLHKHITAVSLTEGDEELAVASALVRRQSEDARHVISIWRLFLLKQRERGGKKKV